MPKDAYTASPQTLRYKNATIAYYVSGAERGETLLLLHSSFADHRIFAPQAARFGDRYRIVSVDLPGHGASRVRGTSVNMGETPELIARLLDRIGSEDCHIVGVSIGSLLAQAFADRYPRRVRSITAVGGFSLHHPSADIHRARFLQGLKLIGYFAFSMEKFRAYVTRISSVTEGGRRLLGAGIREFRRSSLPAMGGIGRLFASKRRGAEPPPLLIVCGGRDLPIMQSAAQRWHSIEPRSRLLFLRDAGHIANVDSSDEFNSGLEHFLGSLGTVER